MDEISYKNLRKIQQLEKTSPLISKIDINFYKELSNYLISLKDAIKQEGNSEKVRLFQEEINNTEKIAFSIYEFREKKIVQAALSKARGGKPDLKNALEVEKNLFDRIVKIINENREIILMQKQNSKKDKNSELKLSNKEEKNNNHIVRVLENIPEFVGTDMKTYNLRKDDVLTVSEEMLNPLMKRDVVKEIK